MKTETTMPIPATDLSETKRRQIVNRNSVFLNPAEYEWRKELYGIVRDIFARNISENKEIAPAFYDNAARVFGYESFQAIPTTDNARHALVVIGEQTRDPGFNYGH